LKGCEDALLKSILTKLILFHHPQKQKAWSSKRVVMTDTCNTAQKLHRILILVLVEASDDILDFIA
jgi:hypothetical protein